MPIFHDLLQSEAAPDRPLVCFIGDRFNSRILRHITIHYHTTYCVGLSLCVFVSLWKPALLSANTCAFSGKCGQTPLLDRIERFNNLPQALSRLSSGVWGWIHVDLGNGPNASQKRFVLDDSSKDLEDILNLTKIRYISISSDRDFLVFMALLGMFRIEFQI